MNLKKSIILLLLTSIMTFSLTGCVAVNFPNIIGGAGSLEGEGEMKTMEYSVSEYTSLNVAANVDIIYTEAPFDKIKVILQENLVEYLTVEVVNGELMIESDVNFLTSDNKTPVVYISVPTLEHLSCSGSVTIRNSSPIRGSKFHLSADGNVSGSLELDTDKAEIDMNGLGDITLSGKSSQMEISMDGMGSINALKLDSMNSTVNLNGMGKVSINSSDTLDILIDGMGSVEYKGTPTLNKTIDGMGSVKQLD